ncbi:ATP-dependent helicase [Priestia megaterium]|uniref:ATP-dependent helicase n=1 Tax=Priestia megaterium TaxID=1404 RepID=UPI002E1DC070|nr:ATP-dependent helicase [Priestia megaterium]
MNILEVIIDKLNEEQKKAATSTAKYLQVSAGPGTGKTSTLAARIFNLQYNYDLSPNEIISISFSRTAKQQLTYKMQSYTEQLGYGSIIEVLTFHSLAHRIVRYGNHTGESKFKNGFQTVYTEDFIKVQPSILKSLCPEYANRDLVGSALAKGLNLVRQGKQLNRSMYKHWSEIKPDSIYKVNMDANDRVIIKGKDMIEFWKRIERIEKTKNIIDFQGLITEATKLLEKRSDAYNMITKQLQHILVDEYQDSSLSQEDFLFSLADHNKNITVVGDKNQAIYTFNGSNPDNLDRFYFYFKEIAPRQTERIYLQKNYRSTKDIVNLSNHFIGKKYIEHTTDTKKDVTKPIIVNTHSIKLAAAYIGSKIQELKHEQNISYNDICILYRKNSVHAPQANEVIKALENYGIPWKDNSLATGDGVNIKEKVLKICDEYPVVELEELLGILKVSYNCEEEALELIKDAILQGAVDTDDLIDYLIDLDESLPDGIKEYVTLRTVHGAKGQEYPIVFILYIGDRQFPHGNQPDIEEEKRLLYVGITRAMNQLYIIGQRGIQHEDFLGHCMSSSEVEVKHFHSHYSEENVDGFNEKELLLINETTKAFEIEEEKNQKRLVDMMEDW